MTPKEKAAAKRRTRLCPRPTNNAPDQQLASDCISAGDCGCVYGNEPRPIRKNDVFYHQHFLDAARLPDKVALKCRITKIAAGHV